MSPRILDCRNRLRRLVTAVPALLLGVCALTMNNSAMAHNLRPPPNRPPPCVPELSSGLVLLPIVITVMLVPLLQVWRKRAAQKELTDP